MLGLPARPEVSGNYEKVDIGILIHAVLTDFFSSTVGREMRVEDLDPARMASIVGRRFAAAYGPAETGAGRLLLAQIQDHLGHFLTDYMQPLLRETPVMTVALEERLMKAWQGFTIAGRLDAVQRRGNDLVVIDYKTGHDAKSHAINFGKLDPQRRETWSAAIGSLQLRFYLLLRRAADLERSDVPRHTEVTHYPHRTPARCSSSWGASGWTAASSFPCLQIGRRRRAKCRAWKR